MSPPPRPGDGARSALTIGSARATCAHGNARGEGLTQYTLTVGSDGFYHWYDYDGRGQLWMRNLLIVLGTLLFGALACRNQSPKDARALAARGWELHRQGDIAGAIAAFDQAIAVDPNEPLLYHHRANARVSAGEFDLAMADWERALSLGLNAPQLYSNRGRARVLHGDSAGALADYNKALSLDPDYANAYNNRGYLRQAQGDVDGALGDYERAIVLNPGDPYFYSNRASARLAKGDAGGAASDLEKAIAMDSTNAEGFCNTGLLAIFQRRAADAEAAFQRCYGLDPKLKPRFERQRRIIEHSIR